MKKTEIMKQAMFEKHEPIIKAIYVLHGIIFQTHLTQLFSGIYSKQDISCIIQSLKEHGLVRTYTFFSNQVIVLSNFCIQKLSKQGESNEYFTYNSRTRLKTAFITAIVLQLLEDKIKAKKLTDFNRQPLSKQLEHVIGYFMTTEKIVRDAVKLGLLNEYRKTNDVAEIEKYKTEKKQIQMLQIYYKKNNPDFLNKLYAKIEKEYEMYNAFLSMDDLSKYEILEDYTVSNREQAIADLLEMLKEVQRDTNLLKKKDENLLKSKRKEFNEAKKAYQDALTDSDKSDYETANRIAQMDYIVTRFGTELKLQELKLKQMLTKIPEQDKKEMSEIDEALQKALEELGKVEYSNPLREQEIRQEIEMLEKRLEGLNLEKKGIDHEIEALGIGTDTLADLRNKFVYVESMSLELDREKHNINITIAVADVMHSLTGASFARLIVEAYDYFKLFFYLKNDAMGTHEDYMNYNFRFKAYLPNSAKQKALEDKRTYITEYLTDKGILNGDKLDKIEFEMIDLNLTNTVFAKQAYFRKTERRRIRKYKNEEQELLDNVI